MSIWQPPAIRVDSWMPAIRASATVAVELCSGMGAIGIGLRSLGIRVSAAYDSWNSAVAVYNHNAPGSVAVQCDLLSKKGFNRVVSDCRQLGELDLLVAGPPCKGFSQLVNGQHCAANPHNRVLKAMPSYVASLRPRIVLIENVPDLIRHAGGRTFKKFANQLKAPGPRRLHYRVEYQVYDASQYGTPQARRRLFLLAVRDGDNGHLPPPGPDLAPLYAALRQSAAELLPNTRTPAVRSETVKRLRHIPPGGCARSIPKTHLNGLSRRFGSAYRRLHPDAPSTTLSTKYDCAYHYAFARSLSVREYARIQGIPDFVTIPEAMVSRRAAYEMIGNSVPPLLVRAIVGEVLQLQLRET